MDVFLTVLPWTLVATVMNVMLAAAGGTFVLFILARRRTAGATVLASRARVAGHQDHNRYP